MNVTNSTIYSLPYPSYAIQKVETEIIDYLSGYLALVIFFLGVISVYIRMFIHKRTASVLRILREQGLTPVQLLDNSLSETV